QDSHCPNPKRRTSPQPAMPSHSAPSLSSSTACTDSPGRPWSRRIACQPCLSLSSSPWLVGTPSTPSLPAYRRMLLQGLGIARPEDSNRDAPCAFFHSPAALRAHNTPSLSVTSADQGPAGSPDSGPHTRGRSPLCEHSRDPQPNHKTPSGSTCTEYAPWSFPGTGL